jgi:hypothetical protein
MAVTPDGVPAVPSGIVLEQGDCVVLLWLSAQRVCAWCREGAVALHSPGTVCVTAPLPLPITLPMAVAREWVMGDYDPAAPPSLAVPQEIGVVHVGVPRIPGMHLVASAPAARLIAAGALQALPTDVSNALAVTHVGVWSSGAGLAKQLSRTFPPAYRPRPPPHPVS